MLPGTIVRLPDGRVGTVVAHTLIGDGIKWGRHKVTMEDIKGSGCGIIGVQDEIPDDYQWGVDAWLRAPSLSARLGPCVGEKYEIEEDDADVR